MEKVLQLLTTICRLMNDNSLQLEVQRDIERLRMPSYGNDETVLDEFSEHYEKEKSSRKAVTSITNEERTFHQTIAKVAILHEGNEQEQSTEQRTQPLRPVDMYPVQVTEAVLELVVQTNNTTGNARISRDLVNIVNNQEVSSEPSVLRERRDEIIAHVINTFSYYGEFYARQGCVQICVKPRTVKLLFELFEDCVSGEITKKLKPVEELIRGFTNFETYTQEIVLYQDHYDTIMNEIASQIRQQFKDRGFTLENESIIPRVELSQKGTILVRVQCPSVDERDQFDNTFQSGYMNKLFEPLEEILSAAYGENSVSLKAHAIDGTPVISEIADKGVHHLFYLVLH
ncbi:uncharacterized protein LOC127866051 [Dreissena polymorpha]|uniref:uncharacterized protein LOC127866051 n=1 Tax=Dreissena polymorpha TaxID=45954 RepID=UPI00226510A1|nr:uncharacterized protein LOC127866051 [Dreissena polymorpha]